MQLCGIVFVPCLAYGCYCGSCIWASCACQYLQWYVCLDKSTVEGAGHSHGQKLWHVLLECWPVLQVSCSCHLTPALFCHQGQRILQFL